MNIVISLSLIKGLNVTQKWSEAPKKVVLYNIMGEFENLAFPFFQCIAESCDTEFIKYANG